MPEKRYPDSPLGSASYAFAVTPHDSDALEQIPRALYVGTGGDLVVNMADSDEDVTFVNVPDGSVLDVQVRRVKTASTAADIVALG